MIGQVNFEEMLFDFDPLILKISSGLYGHIIYAQTLYG